MDERGSGLGHRPLVIGVAGGTGAGKTTISRAILSYIGEERIAYIQHDAYYRDLGHLPLAERSKQNFDHPDALEDDLLLHHLHLLCEGKAVQVPIYDFGHHTRSGRVREVKPRPVILLEGILLFVNPKLRDVMDIKIYVDADADIRFIRRLERDVQERGRSVTSVINQYLETVRPMHLEFVEPSKRYADIIVPQGRRNSVALEMICARIERMLG